MRETYLGIVRNMGTNGTRETCDSVKLDSCVHFKHHCLLHRAACDVACVHTRLPVVVAVAAAVAVVVVVTPRIELGCVADRQNLLCDVE